MIRLLPLLLLACGPGDGDGTPAKDGEAPLTRFPDDFAFGSATAGFQVDMGCPTLAPEACEDRASDWYQWVTDPGIVATGSLHVKGDPVSMGPGMWETFEDDVAMMRADEHDSYRMSLEWSRIFPEPIPDEVYSVDDIAPYANADAIARYHEMFEALRSEGIEPVVTINHYTLPLWVHDGVACHTDPTGCTANGWLDKDRIVRHTSLYAGFVAREFGREVDTWFTLNEPYATTLSGYLMPGEDRSAPPGLTFDVEATKAVLLNQIEAHAEMTRLVREEDLWDASGNGTEVEVGIVMNMVAITPKDPNNPDDIRGAEHMDYLYHQLYLDALAYGKWDGDLDGDPESSRSDLAYSLDLIGINYYNEVVVTGLPAPLREEIPVFDFFPEFSWEPHPEGLTEVVLRAAEWNRPILITENGTPYVDDRGVEVLEGHLAALLDAMGQGAEVRGYHYWSWVDNYEWNHGFDLRFGLYELDVDTKERIQRPVADRLRRVIQNREL